MTKKDKNTITLDVPQAFIDLYVQAILERSAAAGINLDKTSYLAGVVSGMTLLQGIINKNVPGINLEPIEFK